MKILWFLTGVEGKADGLYSQYASSRIRGLDLIEHIDHEVIVVSLPMAEQKIDLRQDLLDQCDLAIFGKISVEVVHIASLLKERRIPFIVDICDTINDKLFGLYSHIIGQATQVVAASETIKSQLSQIGIDALCIGDGQSGSRKTFTDTQGEKVKLLWFGATDNVVPMREVIDRIADESAGQFELDIVTNVTDFFTRKVSPHISSNGKSLKTRVHQWSLELLDQFLSDCDLVIIPSSELEFHQSKTANRLMTAIWAGKSTVAYPVPSYNEFSDFVELTEDIVGGIRAVLATPAKERALKVHNGQDYIEANHSSSIRGREWSTLIEETALRHREGQVVRLNLGCGDKILDNYINVDIVDERSGAKPDVQCDIQNLVEFDDNSADEILSVHVIEHFYYWEVKDVLKEWVRVLKPGGQMVIECPNLLSACKEICENPDTAAMPGKAGQRSMWALYGDPSWKDPLMMHKWLYTPQSLARLMLECGLAEVKQIPARFKLREPRDMRLVAIKPFQRESA